MDRIIKGSDFWAGVLFVTFGLAGLWFGLGYPFGTTAQMGPGYFPRVISSALVLIGVAIVVRAVRGTTDAEPIGIWPIRAIVMVLGGMVIFGLVAPHLGFVAAAAAITAIAGLASSEVRIGELLVFTVLLVIAVTAVFIYGLRLNIPVFPWG